MKDDIITVVANACAYVLALVDLESILKIIAITLSILISILTLTFRLIKWYKNAKADGKITKEEISDAIEIVQLGSEEIKKSLEKKDEDNVDS